MSFESVTKERRMRFVEILQLLNWLEIGDRDGETTSSANNKSMRGLFLVGLYGAFERSTNATVDEAISEISSHQSACTKCNPEIFTIFRYSSIKSIRDASRVNVFEKSLHMFSSIKSAEKVSISDNPLAEIMQNVDGNTLIRISRYFGIENYEISWASRGRLGNLKERRNAVAHGREAPATAGERFSYQELRNMYAVADTEAERFIDIMKDYCENRRYISKAA